MTTPTSTANERKCASFSRNVATLTPLCLQANIVPKKSIEKPHYKRHRTKKPTEFHLPTPTIHKTLQSKMSFSKASILRNDPETKHVFPLPQLISFKRDKNIGNFLVRSAFKSDNQAETFKCTRTRRKTCPFTSNMVKISGPNRSAKITDHFTCISVNFIYCITCTLCKKIYIGETWRRLADRFSGHLRDVEKDDTDASKPVARHFNLPNHSHHSMIICGLSLHHGNAGSRKSLEYHHQFIFPLGTL